MTEKIRWNKTGVETGQRDDNVDTFSFCGSSYGRDSLKLEEITFSEGQGHCYLL
jgi:hypothetical protein